MKIINASIQNENDHCDSNFHVYAEWFPLQLVKLVDNLKCLNETCLISLPYYYDPDVIYNWLKENEINCSQVEYASLPWLRNELKESIKTKYKVIIVQDVTGKINKIKEGDLDCNSEIKYICNLEGVNPHREFDSTKRDIYKFLTKNERESKQIKKAIDFVFKNEIKVSSPWVEKITYSGEVLFDVDKNNKTEHVVSLSKYRDLFLGPIINHLKYNIIEKYSEILKELIIEKINQLEIDKKVDWVTCIPSSSTKNFIKIAEDIADDLKKPFVNCIFDKGKKEKQRNVKKCKFAKCNNIKDAFGFKDEDIIKKPCLLIDDNIDLGLTIAEIGKGFKKRGVSYVYPLTFSRIDREPLPERIKNNLPKTTYYF